MPGSLSDRIHASEVEDKKVAALERIATALEQLVAAANRPTVVKAAEPEKKPPPPIEVKHG